MNLLSKSMKNNTYHIYLRGECLFKDLDEYEFDVIWGRIYQTYFKDDLTFEQVDLDDAIVEDASY